MPYTLVRLYGYWCWCNGLFLLKKMFHVHEAVVEFIEVFCRCRSLENPGMGFDTRRQIGILSFTEKNVDRDGGGRAIG
jgi:hypothetical protein